MTTQWVHSNTFFVEFILPVWLGCCCCCFHWRLGCFLEWHVISHQMMSCDGKRGYTVICAEELRWWDEVEFLMCVTLEIWSWGLKEVAKVGKRMWWGRRLCWEKRRKRRKNEGRRRGRERDIQATKKEGKMNEERKGIRHSRSVGRSPSYIDHHQNQLLSLRLSHPSPYPSLSL